MGKTITRGTIEKVNKMYDELDVLRDKSSELLKQAKLNKGNIIGIGSGEKMREITEGQAWEEIRIEGNRADPFKMMKEKYPEVFEISEQHGKKAKEIDEFIMESFSVSSTKLTFRDILNLVTMKINDDK